MGGPDRLPKSDEPREVDGPYGPYDPNVGAYGAEDPGGGPYNPETGLRDWYNLAEKPAGPSFSWAEILDVWAFIELDLHDRLGVDVESGILVERSWRWLALRILDAVYTPGTRASRALQKPTATAGGVENH